MRRFTRIVALAAVLALPALAQETAEKQGDDFAAWQQAAEKRYAVLGLEEAESKAYFQNQMRKLNFEKAQAQAKEDALYREKKHAVELREREAAMAKVMAPAAATGPACRTCPDKGGCALLLLACAITHLLLAIWVYQDVRRRNVGSGIWIVVTLITGLLGAFVYALVRIGDSRTPAGA
ncbi:MAG: hypothetical protein K8T26_10530 [Lentisphaerae bacterium]|nr:hypothetical protein [Lentisphaerota bacterium]